MGRLSFHWEAMYEVLVMSGQTSVRDRQVNAQIEHQGAVSTSIDKNDKDTCNVTRHPHLRFWLESS